MSPQNDLKAPRWAVGDFWGLIVGDEVLGEAVIEDCFGG